MLVFLLGCGRSTLDQPASPAPAPPEQRPAAGLPLDLAPVEVTLDLPPSSRPDAAPAPTDIPLVGPFVPDADAKGKSRADVFKVPLPIGADLLPTPTKGTHVFGSAPPDGFVLVGPDGKTVPFERRGRRPGSYGFDRDWLYVGVERGANAPDPAGFHVRFPRATRAEAELNLATSGMDPATFARRTFTVDGTSHRGLLLPAPATATFRVTVPPAGRLELRPMLLPPAIRGQARSGGATVRVIVRADGEERELGAFEATEGDAEPRRVDLQAFAGRQVELVLRTDPGDDATLDYVLVEDPVLYTPSDHPRRTVLVFVDTTRADHLGFLGYERNTTPVLDRWAAHAAVFTHARSVAPWTLPSTRAVLSGNEPEQWYAGEHLAGVFSAAGWRTQAIVCNAFLSQPFDVQEGWASYRYEHLLEPPDVVRAGIEALEAEPDRDELLLVHFMGPHLPWEEPWTYRWWWAGSRPDALRSDSRSAISMLHEGMPGFDEVKDYVTARYDQNVRWTDHALEALLEEAGPDATVVFFSDHGEELWDHDGYEHGHTLFDELLHVPLAMKGPNVPEGRYDAPVSLMDVMPTVRELAGIPPGTAPVHGRSLVPYVWGTDGAEQALRDRPLAFGRPLYGADGWGVLSDGHKWTSRAGTQTLFDLGADPEEQHDLAAASELQPWPDVLAKALDRGVDRVWRVDLQTATWPYPLELTLSHPAGFTRVWPGYDPRGRAAATRAEVVDGRVTMHVDAGGTAPSTLYLVPAGDPLDPTGLALTLVGKQVMVGGTAAPRRLEPGPRSEVFLTTGDGRFRASVSLDVAPEPSGVEVEGFHPDLRGQLEELGYLDP